MIFLWDYFQAIYSNNYYFPSKVPNVTAVSRLLITPAATQG